MRDQRGQGGLPGSRRSVEDHRGRARPSTNRRSGEPGPSRCSCPTTSSRPAGRIRTANGEGCRRQERAGPRQATRTGCRTRSQAYHPGSAPGAGGPVSPGPRPAGRVLDGAGQPVVENLAGDRRELLPSGRAVGVAVADADELGSVHPAENHREEGPAEAAQMIEGDVPTIRMARKSASVPSGRLTAGSSLPRLEQPITAVPPTTRFQAPGERLEPSVSAATGEQFMPRVGQGRQGPS